MVASLLSGEAESLAHYSDSQKGVIKLEQLNIVGKRSGNGFVAHKAMLVNALSRALAVMDLTIGRKGFLGYLRALGGSNVVKVIPDASASGSQANGHKRLKVIPFIAKTVSGKTIGSIPASPTIM